MTETTQAPTTGKSKLSEAAYLVLGLIMMPFAFLISPKFVIQSFKDGNRETLSAPETRSRITFETINKTPSQIRLNDVRELVCELVDDHDWLTLSDLIQDWDQARAAAPDGTRLSRYALTVVCEAVSDGVIEGNVCHPLDIPYIPDETAHYFEGVASNHPTCYPLAAICAYLRICQGWTGRGSEYAQYVSIDSWGVMERHFKRAIWLLEPHDAKQLDAPLLASVRFDLLAFLPNAETLVHQYYNDWSTLDPADQEPHHCYGFMLLPRWFGSYTLLEDAAQKAYAATHNITDAAAYATLYLAALPLEIGLALHLDLDLFLNGVSDLVHQSGNDPAVLAYLVQETPMSFCVPLRSGLTREEKTQIRDMAKTVDTFCHHLTRTRMTAIHPDSWQDGVDEALDYISEGLIAEMAEGHRFLMGPHGIEIVQNDPPSLG